MLRSSEVGRGDVAVAIAAKFRRDETFVEKNDKNRPSSVGATRTQNKSHIAGIKKTIRHFSIPNIFTPTVKNIYNQQLSSNHKILYINNLKIRHYFGKTLF